MCSCRRLLILVVLACCLLTQAFAVGIFSTAEQDDVRALQNYLQTNPRLLDATNDAGESLLQIAAANGAIEVTKVLLAKGVDLEANGGFSRATPLIRAVNGGHFDIATLLLARGAKINATHANGDTPLRIALMKHHTKLTNLLRAQGGLVAIGNPLFDAADGNDPAEIARVLKENPDALNAIDSGGWTALHVAALLGRRQAVETLLAHAAKMDREDVRGFTPLHLAIMSGKLPVATLLLEHGAPVERAGSNHTPLMLAAFDNKPEMLELLLAKGANVNARGQNGHTPLQWAILGKSEAITATLLQAGADPNLMDARGETPLHLRQSAALARLLIDHGADVNARDNTGNLTFSEGDTPLHTAALFGSLDVVKLLLARGANINTRNKFDKTPLSMALEHQQPAVAAYLRQYGGVETVRIPGAQYLLNRKGTLIAPLWYLMGWLGATRAPAGAPGVTLITYQGVSLEITAGQGDVLLLEGGATYIPVRTFCQAFGIKLVGDMQRREAVLTHPQTKETLVLPLWGREDYQWTTLNLDAYGNSATRLTARLEAGADPNVRDTGGMTALHWAARNGRTEIITVLLAHKAFLEAREHDRLTPLHLAVRFEQQAAVELLLAKGANLHARTCIGRTPLHLAVEAGNKALVALLLAKGAKTDAVDYLGQTPLALLPKDDTSGIADLLTKPPVAEDKQEDTPPTPPATETE